MGEGRRVYALTARGELGPFTAEEMREELAAGRVQPGDQVRTATGAMVGTAGEFAGVRTPTRVRPPRTPATAETPPTPRAQRQPASTATPASRTPLLIGAGVAAAAAAVILALANRSPPGPAPAKLPTATPAPAAGNRPADPPAAAATAPAGESAPQPAPPAAGAIPTPDEAPGLATGLHASYHAGFTGLTNELAARRPTGTQPGWGPAPIATTRTQAGAIRWQGFLKVPATGAWRLRLTATTGARIWIDGKDTLGTDSGKTATMDRALTAGLHPLVIAHRFAAGPDRLLVEWEGPGTPRQPLPLAAFRQRTGAEGPPSGGALWEQWPGMNDLAIVARLSVPPERWQVVGELSAPTGAGEMFLARLRAVLTPPATGDYRFWLAADDRGILRLSEDASPARARDIARCNGAHRPDEFTDDVRSQPVRLEQGRRYFIEVWHAEDHVLDHAVVAWEGPGIPRQVVPGSRLAPWVP